MYTKIRFIPATDYAVNKENFSGSISRTLQIKITPNRV